MNKSLSNLLDLCRWVSAFLVVLAHINNRMFTEYVSIPARGRTLDVKAWTFLQGFGHQSVLVFFVLSGFLVGGRLLDKTRQNARVDFSRYALDRFSRIYVVLAASLALTLVLDICGRNIYPEAYRGFAGHWSVGTLVGNLLCLQNFYALTWGTNGPIGTLANECWYYLTFPLLLAPVLSYLSGRRRAALFLLGIAACCVTGLRQPEHLFGFVIWLIGVGVALPSRPIIRSPKVATAVFVAVVIGLRIGLSRQMLGHFWISAAADLLNAGAFGAMLLAFRFTEWETPVLHLSLHKKLAGFSYSLYALHAPMLMFLCAAMKKSFGFGWEEVVTSPRQWVYPAFACAVTLGAAYLVSRVTEAHTATFRNFLYCRLLKNSTRALPSALAMAAGRRPELEASAAAER